MQSAEQTFATAVARHRVGAHAEAAELYRKTLDENPEHTGAMFNLASLSAVSGCYPEAADYYQKILRLNPEQLDEAVADLDRPPTLSVLPVGDGEPKARLVWRGKAPSDDLSDDAT